MTNKQLCIGLASKSCYVTTWTLRCTQSIDMAEQKNIRVSGNFFRFFWGRSVGNKFFCENSLCYRFHKIFLEIM